LAEVYSALATLYEESGDPVRARALFEKAEPLFQALGRDDLLAGLYASRALLCEHMGEGTERKLYLLKALELALQAGLPGELAVIYQELAKWALEEGRLHECGYYLGQAQAIAEEHKLKTEIPYILMTKANLAHRTGRSQDAIALAGEAIQMFRSFGEAHSAVSAAADLGSIYTDLKELGMAERQLNEALKHAEALEVIEPRIKTLEYLGDLEMAKGRGKPALTYYREGLRFAQQFEKRAFIKDLSDKIKNQRRHLWF
jgi:tetratricopeptide (TPR) repeat protein